MRYLYDPLNLLTSPHLNNCGRRIYNRYMKTDNIQAFQFLTNFYDISPLELEEILEYLDDRGYLTEQGKNFRDNFWAIFIKQYVSKTN